MEKQKILVFSTSYHPFRAGAEIAIQESARRLVGEYDFVIVTSRFRRDLCIQEAVPEGVIIRLGLGSAFDKWLFPLFGFVYGWVFLRMHPRVLSWGMDISLGSLSAAMLKFFFRKNQFLFTIQYGYGDERIRKGRLGTINLALRLILSQADRVTAISTYLVNLARAYGYKGKIDLVHNGVDIEKFKISNLKVQTKPQNKKIIITTSRLVPKNGIDILIKAVAEAKKDYPDIECWILGDGPERESYQLLATRYRLEDNVKFFGSIPYEKLPEYLCQADIFARPSRSEGMGNSFIEALAAGVPIVGTPVGGITDIIRDRETGLFARVDDPHDLAQKIILLLSDPALGEALVREGEKMISENFQWTKIAKLYGTAFSSAQKGSMPVLLIATPLFPPQIGGPGLYACYVGEALARRGFSVSVASFGEYLRYPPFIRHVLYASRIFFLACEAEIILLLDPWSVGVPASFVSLALGKKIILRLEGDFLWERFVERTRSDATLIQFYRKPPILNFKEKAMKLLFRMVLMRVSLVVVSSRWRKNLVVHTFPFLAQKSVTIKNVLKTEPWQECGRERKRIILWAGRMLYLKNLYRLIWAFAAAHGDSFELHCVGDGPERDRLESFVKENRIAGVRILPPMSHHELLEKISCSAFVVLPSLSDVGPTIIADSITTGTPFLMTRESGYAEDFCRLGACIDPLDQHSIEQGIKILMDDAKRKEYTEKIKAAQLSRTWDDAAEEWARVCNTLL